jgi:hypothetical protein
MTKFTTMSEPESKMQLQYSNADYEFANWCINNMKRQQRLPLQFKQADVFGAMQDKCPWWYEMYPQATQDDYVTFDIDLLKVPQKYLDKAGVDKSFKLHTHQVLLPPDVASVYECFYNTSGYVNRSLLNYANWSLEYLLMSSTYGTYPRMNVDTYAASFYCLNLLDSLSKEPVKFVYNHDTHLLQVYDLGYRSGYIIMQVSRYIPVQNFYNNPWFRQLIMAAVLEARADSIDLFGAQLPGDLSVNTGVLRDRARSMQEAVDKQIELENGTEFYAIKS